MGEAKRQGKPPRSGKWRLSKEPIVPKEVAVFDTTASGPAFMGPAVGVPRGRLPTHRTGKAKNLAASTGVSVNPTFRPLLKRYTGLGRALARATGSWKKRGA